MIDRFNRWIAEKEFSDRAEIFGIVFFATMLGTGAARAWFGF